MVANIISVSLLTGAVILIRAVFRKNISARLTYLLWLAVIIKLCIPFGFIGIDIPELSSFADTQNDSQISEPIAENESAEPDFDVTPPVLPNNSIKEEETAKQDELLPSQNNAEPSLNIKNILITVWVCGSMITFLVITVSAIIFNIRLIRARTFHSLSGKTKVFISEYTASPCVSGIIPLKSWKTRNTSNL